MDRSQDTDATNTLQQLVGDISMLVRQELQLAKTELAEKATSAGIGAGMLSAAALTGLITLGCLAALFIVALALVLPLWAAVVIVTMLWGTATATLALLGKRKVQDATPFVPQQTIENVKEDIAWARSGAKPQND
jgi:uncharacterized membrane protein YqjE